MIRIEEGFPSQTLVRMPVESIERMQQLPLCRALYVTDVGHYPEAHNHFVRRENGCPNHILIYCQGGRGFLKMGKKQEIIEDGQIILIPGNEPHEYGTAPDESWRLYWVHFNGSESEGIFDLLSENRSTNTVYLPRPDALVNAFEETIRWTKRGHTRSHLVALSGACSRLLSLMIEGKRPSANRARQVEERVRATIARMRENLRNPMTLDQLAEEAALSIPHYCAVFRKQAGNSPMQLYAQLRIQNACELLHNTKLSVRVIAEETGYDDAYYFSRIFKRIMGISPTEYRKGFSEIPMKR